MEEEDQFAPIGRRFRKRNAFYVVLFLLTIGFIIVWLSRISIADNFVRSELEQLNVEAAYEINDIGLDRQVIRNLVLGDPENPDLTAELVEIGNSITTNGPGIDWVRVKNAKLFGRIVDGKLSLGELDKFMDPNDDSPISLPEMWLGVEGGQARIDSEFGAIGLTLNGEGYLPDGFEGEIAVISKNLSLAGCNINDPTFFGEIAITEKKPKLEGPLRLPKTNCADQQLSSEDIAAQINLTLGEDLASWQGNIGLIGGPVKYAAYSAQEIRTSFDIDGDMRQSSGDIELTASGIQSPYAGANMARVNGPLQLSYGEAGFGMQFEGQPVVRAARLAPSLRRQIDSAVASVSDTPVGPIAGKLAAAVNRASNNLDIRSDLKFEMGQEGSNLLLETLEASSRSGASARLSDPLALMVDDNGFAMGGDGNFLLSGGGFPTTRLALDSGSLAAGFSGRLEMATYQADGARLAIPSLRFTPARGSGTNINGRISC